MDHDQTRRMLITGLAGLTLASVSTPSAAASDRGNVQGKSPVLVAYFSRSGNTRVIAGVIHRTLNTDLFEIIPATPYPDDYFQTVKQASHEREQKIRPALSESLATINQYETIYLGFPIWGTSVPSVVQSFLSQHDFSGKQLIPFITHGGYGKGDSDEILAHLAPTAHRAEPLIMECDQERRTTETVSQWLNTLQG